MSEYKQKDEQTYAINIFMWDEKNDKKCKQFCLTNYPVVMNGAFLITDQFCHIKTFLIIHFL